MRAAPGKRDGQVDRINRPERSGERLRRPQQDPPPLAGDLHRFQKPVDRAVRQGTTRALWYGA